MFIKSQVEPKINLAMMDASDTEIAHLYVVQQCLDGRTAIVAGTKELNRYSLLPGKTFARSAKDAQKYKVIRTLADDVVIQDLRTQKITTQNVNVLLKQWSEQGIKEVSMLEDIIQTIKNVLGPALGIFLTTALISWIAEKLK